LDDRQWSSGYLLWNRKPRTHGTNHRRANSQTEPPQSSHGSHLDIRRPFQVKV
jgi:hypothetical protein